MTEQEEKTTSLEYFYDKVLDAAEYYNSEYNDIVKAFEEANKIYRQEIEEAKKEGWRKGYEDAVKFYNQFETK